jgi:hypothetical protein
MKDKIKIYLLIILNAFFVVVVLWSMMIYTSLMSDKLPWYEPCGEQFLAILILSCPIFIIFGIIELLLGRFINIYKRLKYLPFICCFGMGLPILIDGSLWLGVQIVGTIFGLITVIAAIYLTTINVIELFKVSNRVAGGFSPPAPTPPGMRVRTGRFTKITGP